MTDPAPAVTAAMRQAVYDADCAAHGHIYVFDQLLYSSANGGTGDTIGAATPDRLAHIRCRRCGRVWLVLEQPGASYEDAVAQLRGALADPAHPLLTPHARPAEPGITQPAEPDPAGHSHPHD